LIIDLWTMWTLINHNESNHSVLWLLVIDTCWYFCTLTLSNWYLLIYLV
jgi:hypothetical protein